MFTIPKDYEAVRDNCIKNKESKQGHPVSKKQTQDCKRMAAIWWVKKHGKPFPKEEKNSKASLDDISFHIDDKSEDMARKLLFIRNDNDNEISFAVDSEGFLVDIKMVKDDDGFYFTQPFTKEEVNYKLSDVDSEGLTHGECWNCVHFVSTPSVTRFGNGFCHLVQGVINDSYKCIYYATSLIETNSKDESSVNDED